jgi:hypothetical protein
VGMGSGSSGEQEEVEMLRQRIEKARLARDQAKAEAATILDRREKARTKLISMRGGEKMAAIKQQSQQRKQERAAKQTADASNRKSTAQNPNVAVAERLGNVLETMAKLEAAIIAAEDGQAKAENELIEFATEQREREKATAEVILELTKIQDMLSRIIDQLPATTSAAERQTALQLKLIVIQAIKTIRSSSTSDIILNAANGASSTESPSGGGNRATTRMTRSMTTGDLPNNNNNENYSIPVAPPMAPPMAPAAPPMMMSGSGKAVTPSAVAGVESGESLLAQIKAGRQLNKVDIAALQKQRRRTSTMALSNITKTLRKAINVKFEETDEDVAGDGDDWDDDVWDEEDIC